jgi:hypothetical protein
MAVFKGIVHASGIVGSFANGLELTLDRRSSYWQTRTGS